MSASIPQHMHREARLATTWNVTCSFTCLALWLTAIIALPLLWHLSDQILSARTVQTAQNYLTSLYPNPFTHIYEFTFSPNSPAPLWLALTLTITPLLAVLLVSALLVKVNPYRQVDMLHGDARFATHDDIRHMNAAQHVGTTGKYLHLGFFGKSKLSLIETLSVLALAPPGSGKTVRLIVPGILSTDESCFIVHDPKPELWDICSGHRSRLGPTFRLDWAATDDKANGIFHPSFNFLDPNVVPPSDGGKRDTFIDALAKILIPEANARTDTYFTDKGRNALVGFTHFLIAHINDSNDPARYDDLPEQWRGKHASFPMLVDMLTFAQQKTTQKTKTPPAAGQSPPQSETDPLHPYLEGIVNHSIEHDYPKRIVRELQQLVNMADRERSGVLGTMDKGLSPFKNEAVTMRTSYSDFCATDLGGRLKSSTLQRLGLKEYPRTGEAWANIKGKLTPQDWEPVSIFVCLKTNEAPAFEMLTAMFFEVCSNTLLAYGPNETTSHGILMGPYTTCFLMDELVKMARCDCVINGPDIGRSKGRYYVLVAQAIDQIKERYSNAQANTIISTCAVKVVLEQNDPASIEALSRTTGKTTVKRASYSRTVGFSKQANPFAANRSDHIEGVNLLNVSNLGHMPNDKHLLIVQGFLNRPVWCRSAFFFTEPRIAPKAFNPRTGKGPLAAPPLPEEFTKERYEEYVEEQRKSDDAKALAERERALDHWRYNCWSVETMTDTPNAAP